MEHFLKALNFQAMARGSSQHSTISGAMSDNIWSSLRLALSMMGRRDLNHLLDSKDLEGLSRAFEPKPANPDQN